MPTFQLDECLNDPGFVQTCEDDANENQIAGVMVKRFPNRLKQKKDPEVLADLLKLNGTILTKDRKLAKANSAFVPNTHAGIVIIANARMIPGTITVTHVKRILAAFKINFGTWHTLPLSNSIIEVTQVGIDVSHVEDGVVIHDDYIEFSDDWKERLTIMLATNSKRR